MPDKFPRSQRTFETRLLFIYELFTQKYSNYDIMASCIDYKLGMSYRQYLKELQHNLWELDGIDPLKVLSEID